jgi:hypothetical protein
MSSEEWCQWFTAVDANPTKIIPGLTIREIYEAREHLHNCDECYVRHQRVISSAPPQTFMDVMGEN